MMLSNDVSASILAMLEPMAGFFEVWARFVDANKFMAIVHVSGLGGVLLRRCECLGKNDSSEHNNIIGTVIVQSPDTSSLDDIEHCNYLQSLSILRTILFRCDGSRHVTSLIYHQFTATNYSEDLNCSVSSFLSSGGVASPADMQTLIQNYKDSWELHCSQTDHLGTYTMKYKRY